MKSDIGAPAFDNIDEILSEKITRHSIHHSDSSTVQPPRVHTPTNKNTPTNEKSRLALIITIIMVVIVVFLFNRALRPQSE